tara:strand:- start:59 stop:568 length:510 start_codon:yes stop_codon:yes gene_type:complete
VIKKVYRKYLEIKSLKSLKSSDKPDTELKIYLKNPPDFQVNKFFYKEIGKKYRWIDRLEWNDMKWIRYTENKNLETFILSKNTEFIGFFELLFNDDNNDCEIAYFGILEEFFGKKYGSYLLSEAIKCAFKRNINRLWLHTCSLDHENALKNYLDRGMTVFKSETINLNI